MATLETWQERLRADGELTVRRSRRASLVFLAAAGLVLAVGATLAGLGGVLGWAGMALAALAILTVFFLGIQAAVPGVIVRLDGDGVEPAGRPKVSWRELEAVEIREEAGGLLVLRAKPSYTKRTTRDLGRVQRWGRRTDTQQFGPHRIRLRTSTPAEAAKLADLLRWAKKARRKNGTFVD